MEPKSQSPGTVQLNLPWVPETHWSCLTAAPSPSPSLQERVYCILFHPPVCLCHNLCISFSLVNQTIPWNIMEHSEPECGNPHLRPSVTWCRSLVFSLTGSLINRVPLELLPEDFCHSDVFQNQETVTVNIFLTFIAVKKRPAVLFFFSALHFCSEYR